MSEDPLLTRQTLLIRLRDSADDASWAEFAEIYTPLMVAYCRKRELRHADTSDIVQDVMRSVSLAMQNFEYDPDKGKFKAWLFTAVRHAVGDHFKKKARQPIYSRWLPPSMRTISPVMKSFSTRASMAGSRSTMDGATACQPKTKG